MEMKRNQTSFHGAYSNLTVYISLSKIIKIFQWFQNQNFSVNPNNGMETKLDIFPWDIFKKVPKYFN